MTQYKTQYGTIFAVKEHNGAPAIMCRAEHSETWSLSSMIEPFTPGAWTTEELQGQLDNWAATKGWQPVEAPASAEPPEIVDEGSGPDDGFPDWVQSMAAEFLQFDFVRALPAFTATELKNSDPVRHHQGGSIADNGLYDTGPKGIKFTVFLSNRYLEKYYTWPDFVRRCKAAGLAPEPLHQDKEDAPCNTEPPAPTGDAAATTDGSAAPEPSQAAETSTASAEPARQAPAALPLSAPDTAPSSLPAFDYAGLDDQTVQDLHLAEREVAGGKRMAEMGLRRMADGVAIAHDALCVTIATKCRNGNGEFSDSEKTFGRWCESVGLNRKAAERLLQVSKLFDNSTPREQKVLEELGPSLLYAAAKPSSPPELVQAVKDRDITTAKEFRELEAQLKAERAAREQAEQECNQAIAARDAARDAQVNLSNISDKIAKQRDDALKQRDDANRRATEAEKQRDGARDENTSLKAQIRELEARPVEVAVTRPGEEQIEAWRKEGEARATAALRESIRKADQAKADAQRQVDALQDQLAATRPDADACQRTVDTLYETTENLRLLLRTQLRQAQLPPATYGTVVAHVLQAADALRDTVRSCAPAGYTMDDEEDDFL